MMSRIFQSFCLIILFALPLSALAATDSAAQQLEKKLSQIKTLQADFQQSVRSDSGQMLQSSRGNMALSRPGKFRFATLKPTPQLIIADGNKLWIYDEDLLQVTVKPQKEGIGNTPAMLLASSNSVILDNYTVSRVTNKQGDVFQLQPKDSDAQFVELHITFTDGAVSKMELRDVLGQQTIIEFSHVKLNQPINPALFQFTPPKGVDVIGTP